MQQANTKKTFIVDDDPFWVAMLTQILTEIGYTNIVTFENGTDCINNLHLNPSLVFLDYQMDDINGIDVLQKIKDYYPNIRVIFCTALEDIGVAVDAIKFGSFDYLLKSNATKKEIISLLQAIENKY
jgi:DNA-binding NtrC family response regulator